MDRDTRKAIGKVTSVLEKSYNLQPGFDIKGLVGLVGGKLIEDDSIMDAEIIGESTADTKFTLRYNPNKPDNRIRFSIAHELGHFFLHLLNYDEETKEFKIEPSRFSRGLETNLFEAEASEFAASLLMPEDKFREVCKAHYVGDLYQLEEVANNFKVSVKSVIYRGYLLGLWKM